MDPMSDLDLGDLEERDTPDLPAIPRNPSLSPYPSGLALELVIQTGTPTDILAAYGLTVTRFKEITALPMFKKEYAMYLEMAKEDGFSYRMKCKAQAEGMLKIQWDMVHDITTPPSVRADLIKFNARVAGYDKKDTGMGESDTREKITININLGPEGTSDNIKTISS